ncbi:hypothetical protein SESBI_19536 [Sesbania bispinosa]|nr:hypothetical protein SESBI_19536 [Sesbania bispinosa]
MAATLPAVSSDHSPLVFWTQPKQGSGNSFKYEALWRSMKTVQKLFWKVGKAVTTVQTLGSNSA